MSLTILALALFCAGNGGDDAQVKKEQDRLQGTWVVKESQVGSNAVTRPNGDNLIDFEGDKMFITRNGKRAAMGLTITLDPTKSPRAMNLQGGDHRYRGIYEFDGKRLRICYHQSIRPTKFDSQEQQQEPFNVRYELERN